MVDMNDLFEGARFGDKFVTRDGNVAIFHRRFTRTCHAAPGEPSFPGVSLMVKGQAYLIEKGLDGKDMTDYYVTTRSEQPTDIVGRWEEPIDEDRLDEIANAEYPSDFSSSLYYDSETDINIELREAFKKGYRLSKRCSNRLYCCSNLFNKLEE